MSGSCTQLTVDVPDHLKDIVLGELADAGVAGIWESGEPLPGVVRLEVYFNVPDSVSNAVKLAQSRILAIFKQAGVPPPLLQSSAVADRDWLGEWKKSYVSFPIGRRFFVIPSWSDSQCPPDRLPIRIDPGQAFGTGTHETTQLMTECLETCAERLDRSARIVDLGTGSGILVIAASLLGFTTLTGCDNDSDSVTVAVENLERNGIAGARLYCGSIDVIDTASVDLLLCNLTTEVIAELFDDIVRAIRPGGSAVLSGILVEQRERICRLVSENGFVIEAERVMGEWMALVIRNGNPNGF